MTEHGGDMSACSSLPEVGLFQWATFPQEQQVSMTRTSSELCCSLEFLLHDPPFLLPFHRTSLPSAYSCSLTLYSIQVLLLTNPLAMSPIMEASSQTTWTNTSSLSQYLCLYVSLSSTNWALNLSLQTALLYSSVSTTPAQTLNYCNKLLPDLLPLTDPTALIVKPFGQLLIFYRIRLKSLCFAWHASPSFTWPWLLQDQSLGT